MLGFTSAKRVLEIGREAFFAAHDENLPPARSSIIADDDLTPQFGYVGSRYDETRVLLLGVNPGNGPRDSRSGDDEMMLPALRRFRDYPSEDSFRAAGRAYFGSCQAWPVWRRLLGELIGENKLSFEQIAYSNCLPWRTATGTRFSEITARLAAQHYAFPLIQELKPTIVVALYRRAATILQGHDQSFELIAWNGAQAATERVKSERRHTAQHILGRAAKLPATGLICAP